MLMRRRRGPGLVRMAATTAVVAGTAGAVSHHQQQKYANQAEAQQAEAQAAQPEAAPAAAAEDPTMAELQRLATLHTSGVLTDEEFTAAKAKILGI
jgi:membrane protease subunit (stomatin/prohibitin family)